MAASSNRRQATSRFRIGEMMWVSTQFVICAFIVLGLVYDNHMIEQHLLCQEDMAIEAMGGKTLPRRPGLPHGLRSPVFSSDQGSSGAAKKKLLPPKVPSPTFATTSLIADGNSTKKIWEDSRTLPSWMKSYFQWHAEEREELNEKNWHRKQYLIVRCHVDKDEHCGGASDRLNPLPLFVMGAARSRRLFLIQWTRPCKLENFLIPPENGLNWTSPDWLTEKLEDAATTKRFYMKPPNILDLRFDTEVTAVYVRMQVPQGGREIYDEEERRTPEAYRKVFRDVFRVFFTPVPELLKEIQSAMDSLGLVPGEYAAAHNRAHYGPDNSSQALIALRSVNAVNCASMHRPGGPIFFTSDSKIAFDAVEDYARSTSRPIVTLPNQHAPLHLDKVMDWSDRHPSDFFPTFRDLYILGQAHCIVHTIGGFGRFALLISYDAFCSSKLPKNCGWADATY